MSLPLSQNSTPLTIKLIKPTPPLEIDKAVASTEVEYTSATTNGWLKVPSTSRSRHKLRKEPVSARTTKIEGSVDGDTAKPSVLEGIYQGTIASSSHMIRTEPDSPNRGSFPQKIITISSKSSNAAFNDGHLVTPIPPLYSRPITRLNNQTYMRQRSHLKIQREMPWPLATRSDCQNPSRSIVSIGGPYDFILIQASREDAPALIQAGLEVFLDDMSKKYGFTKTIIIQVYQDHIGSLAKTELTLKAMKGSADEARRDMLKKQFTTD